MAVAFTHFFYVCNNYGFYKLPKTQVVEVVESILHLNGLKILDDYQYDDALKQYASKKAKYVDCLIASMASSKNNQT